MAAARKPNLHLHVEESMCGGEPVARAPQLAQEDSQRSFEINGECFIKGDIAINATGVAMRDADKSFTVVFEELSLGEVIGRGASSYVQRAVHVPTGTQLALKVINMFEKSKRKQIMKEIESLYNAQCPALVTFYGAFHREGAITIALEFMDGGSLSNVLAQLGPLPEAVLASVTYQVLWGLAYLKHVKRVHRDVKPANLLINSSGEVKLTDFGVSGALTNSIAMCGTFVGTFKYMSPERIAASRYGFASDVWSLGVVLVECATGRYPYPPCASHIDMAQTILEAPEPELPAGGGFSPEFHEFVGQCLRKRPADRLPADILLGSPWLKRHGADSYHNAIANVRAWIEGMVGGGGGGASDSGDSDGDEEGQGQDGRDGAARGGAGEGKAPDAGEAKAGMAEEAEGGEEEEGWVGGA